MNIRVVRYLVVFLMILSIATSSANSQSKPKTLVLSDFAYEPEIRTIQLTPDGQPLEPAVMQFGQAPLGLKFYTGNLFPDKYKNQLFVAEHGSWNRSKKSGYVVATVKVNNDKATGHEVFASGWLNNDTQKVWGRPVDVLMMPDGAMLISDDQAGVIYRVSYGK